MPVLNSITDEDYFVLNDIFICFLRLKVFENTSADAGAALIGLI